MQVKVYHPDWLEKPFPLYFFNPNYSATKAQKLKDLPDSRQAGKMNIN